MARETLKEYIDLFDSNYEMRYSAIRGMERLGEWKIAADYWKIIGDKENENACRLIQQSTELGDQYRADVKPLIDWVDNTITNGLMTTEEFVKIVSKKMNAIHKKHYR